MMSGGHNSFYQSQKLTSLQDDNQRLLKELKELREIRDNQLPRTNSDIDKLHEQIRGLEIRNKSLEDENNIVVIEKNKENQLRLTLEKRIKEIDAVNRALNDDKLNSLTLKFQLEEKINLLESNVLCLNEENKNIQEGELEKKSQISKEVYEKLSNELKDKMKTIEELKNELKDKMKTIEELKNQLETLKRVLGC